MLWSNSSSLQIIGLKALLICLLWFFYTKTTLKKKLVFYLNLGVGVRYLFVFVFAIEIILTIICKSLYNLFI
ncbi:hypothetical protein SAMN04487906_1263 [Zhouia amylolytica]|uniref:Uncharacterized protein n=1 Tax=Zhouia amylolytica TaxID=376730 RepID=A0A1I6RRG9_9FLAO|nr:hypothetical protein SAMN04487906_1263 [Zhouia amylolytica]